MGYHPSARVARRYIFIIAFLGAALWGISSGVAGAAESTSAEPASTESDVREMSAPAKSVSVSESVGDNSLPLALDLEDGDEWNPPMPMGGLTPPPENGEDEDINHPGPDQALVELSETLAKPGEGRLVAKDDDSTFSNACTPPSSGNEGVPKSLLALSKQVGEGWQVARRGQLLIASDISQSDFSSLVDGVLAICRASLTREYFKIRPKHIITIYAFRNEESYRNGLRRFFDMSPISPYGHYGHTERYLVINYETGPGTLVHELTHALMAPDFPEAPIWISEGIASLYEQCRVEGDSLKGDQNWRLPELKKALKNRATTSLRELMNFRPKEFRARKESLHYAESRYFCMYLEHLGMLRKTYQEFRDNYFEDPSGIKTVEKITGKKLSEIESDWHQWLQKQDWK